MNDKKCPYMGPGKRCKGGYHLRGTVAATTGSEPTITPPTEVLNQGAEPRSTQDQSSQPQQKLGGNVIIDPINLKDFLGKLIREEMAAAMTQQPAPTLTQQPQTFQPQPPTQQPQQPPQQQQQQRYKSSQDYKMALIGELLTKH